MASFGENLRREREMRGVTLQEISNTTKISVRFLKALENEEFSKLPGGLFARSFCRAYAEYLGLDAEHILVEFQMVAQPKDEYELTRLTVNRAVNQRESSRAPWIAVMAGIALLVGSYFLYRYSRRTAEALPSAPSTSQISPAPARTRTPPLPQAQSHEEPGSSASPSGNPTAVLSKPSSRAGINKPAASATMTAQSKSVGTASAFPIAATNQPGLTLRIAATEKAWVAVEADGSTIYQRVMNPSEDVTLKAKNSFDVITGNAPGIVLTLNGETLKPMGEHAGYSKIHLTRASLKKTTP